MFQTYAVIGSGLLVLGLVYTYYFVRFILTNKAEAFLVTSLSESLVTVFIGVFYIYSAIVLSTNTNIGSTTLNFTNTIDDIVTVNTEGFVPSNVEYSTTKVYENEDMDVHTSVFEAHENGPKEPEALTEVNDYVEVETENSSYTVETTTVIQTTIESEKDDFLTNYKNYIKDLIKQKLSNSSHLNRTVFYNNKEYKSIKTRNKRDAKLEKIEIFDEKCFNEVFMSNALFLYSFIHCSLTLINNTLFCKRDDENATEQKNKEPSNSLEESNSEKNDDSVPVGPLFNESESSTTDTIKELFKARSTHSVSTTKTEEKQNTESEQEKGKCRLITYIIFIWLLPIASVIIFYNLLQNQNVGVKYITSYFNTLNLNSTQASPELVNVIQSPTNVTTANESAEVGNILKNVYNIVNEAQQETTNKKKPHYSTPMTDILYFLNRQYRNPKDYEEDCYIQEMPLKIFFFIFIVMYVLVILYAKVKQAIKSPNGKASDGSNMCILAFSFLWLPSVLELFFRIFLTQTQPNILTDIFLTLGNVNRLFTMIVDYTKSKKLISKLGIVQPVV